MSRDSTLNCNRYRPAQQGSPTLTVAHTLAPVPRWHGGSVLPKDPAANDPIHSIEEAIYRYVDAQPAQLYRGGA